MVPSLPRIFLIPTHLSPLELHDLEDRIPTLTYDADEADAFVGKIFNKERAKFELRRLRIETEPIDAGRSDVHDNASKQPHKRRKVSISKGEVVSKQVFPHDPEPRPSDTEHCLLEQPGHVIEVLKLAWLLDSLEQNVVLPGDDKYLLYRGRKLLDKSLAPIERNTELTRDGNDLVRANPRNPNLAADDYRSTDNPQQPISSISTSSSTGMTVQSSSRGGLYGGRGRFLPPSLINQTSTEHDAVLPPIPAFLHTTYSCQRLSPSNPPNASFIEELKNIRTLRLLRGDQIGVRAYSTAIATLTAYPYPIQGSKDIARLPGCSTKIADLYQQWKSSGYTPEVKMADSDPKLAVLRKFYNIWGVGDATAREFYRKGWRDLDDIIENGWDSLSRVQQIGIKFYDEFQLKISRAEVEAIAKVILDHARRIDVGFQMVIVGGYRRGKLESGDVDVILSHPDESKTLDMIDKVVVSLEKDNFITHTLSLWTRNSERGQTALPWKGEGRPAGSGFDTLDKAMVVWQNSEASATVELQVAPHRRVDIIVSPWKTVGCAVAGWSGSTTFQRDLRRYCKKEKALKFDSSGVRSRSDGRWVDLEGGPRNPAPDMESAERRVFEGLGLPWLSPEGRCAG